MAIHAHTDLRSRLLGRDEIEVAKMDSDGKRKVNHRGMHETGRVSERITGFEQIGTNRQKLAVK